MGPRAGRGLWHERVPRLKGLMEARRNEVGGGGAAQLVRVIAIGAAPGGTDFVGGRRREQPVAQVESGQGRGVTASLRGPFGPPS